MTFDGTWIYDDSEALDETCDLELGTANTPTPTTVSALSCMSILPTEEEDDLAMKFLIYDPNKKAEIGCRVVQNSTKYLAKSIQRDGNYVYVPCQAWPESLT